MCRWFAYVSTNEILLEDVLIRPKNAIAQQIVRYWQGFGQYINADGFGISWYTDERSHFNPLAEGVVPLNLANLLTNGGFGIYDGPVLPFVTGPHPAIYKTTIAKPLNDPSFRSLCANVSSKCIFAHLRAADAPPIATTNNHPFVFGRHCFMHNGFIANFKEIRKEMLRHTFEGFAAMIEGGTDTEHLAALYMTYLCTPEYSQGSLVDSPDALSLAVRRSDQHTLATAMWTALKSAIKTVEDIQAELRARFPDQYKEPFDNLLNISATDGDSLVALCYRSNTAPGREGVPLWLSVDICDVLNRKPYASQKGRIFEDNRPSDEIYEASKRLFNNAKQAINRDDNKGLVINPDLQRLFEEQSQPTASMHGPHVVVASEPATIDDHWWSLGNKEGILVETVRRKGALLLELYPQEL